MVQDRMGKAVHIRNSKVAYDGVYGPRRRVTAAGWFKAGNTRPARHEFPLSGSWIPQPHRQLGPGATPLAAGSDQRRTGGYETAPGTSLEGLKISARTEAIGGSTR